MDLSVSVVVPFLNARKTIIGCVESLLAQSYEGSIEIILVDNNSNDGSLEEVESYLNKKSIKSVKLIPRFSKRGVAAARNAGIREAKGEILAFTDADCIAHKDWIKNLIQGYIDELNGAVAGGIQGYNPQNLFEKFSSVFTLKSLPKPGIFTRFPILHGGFAHANFSVRRWAIKKVGFLDESVQFGWEDYGFCARVYKNGYKINYVPGALIYHRHRSTLKGLVRQAFGFGRAHPMLLNRHFTKMFILELPGITFQSERLSLKFWVSFASLDKKIIIGLILSFIYPLFSFILIAYLIYLISYFYHKARENGLNINLYESLGFIFLMFLKSFSMTAGRLCGSFQEKVICF